MNVGHAGRSRAYRFASRQLEWALTHGDPLLEADPQQLPRRWTAVSLLQTLAVLAGFAVYGVVKPAPEWRESALLLDVDSGALYINQDDVLYPTRNLTSALLLTGGGERTPTSVRSVDIADAPRGALTGIPGAPVELPDPAGSAVDRWSVCDFVPDEGGLRQAAVLIGEPATGVPLTPTQALLATTNGDPSDYLIWNGQRARIDLADPVLATALPLAGQRPRLLGTGLLHALPEVAPISIPVVLDAGTPTTGFTVTAATGQPLAVGSVFTVTHTGAANSYHLIHADGVEEISALAAELLRFAGGAAARLPEVAPSALAAVPIATDRLQLSAALPPSVPVVLGSTSGGVCATWAAGNAGPPRWTVRVGVEPPPASTTVALASRAPGAASMVAMGSAGGAVIRVAVGRSPPAMDAPLWLVSQLGVVYPVDDDALPALGLADIAVGSAPEAVIGLLPHGPALSTAAAQRRWNEVPAGAR